MLIDWKCPRCIDDNELTVSEGQREIETCCERCGSRGLARVYGQRAYSIFETPDGGKVEVIRVSRNFMGWIECQIRPAGKECFPTGVNPWIRVYQLV